MGKECEDYFLKKCAGDALVRDTLAKYIAAKGIKKAVNTAQKEIVKHLSHTLLAVLHSQTAHIITHKVAHVSTIATVQINTAICPNAAHAIGKSIGTVFHHQVALHMKVVL